MPDFEIKGDPGGISRRARSMTKKADLLSSTGTALGEIDSSKGWFGRAADKFHDKYQQEPHRWWEAGGAFRTGAAALDTYADALEAAQLDAEQAKKEYERGQQVTKDAEAAYADYTGRYNKAKNDALSQGLVYPYPKEPYVDPGEEIRKGAIQLLEQAKRHRAEAARVCAAEVRSACHNAPRKRNFLDHALDVAKGVGDIVKDNAGSALTITTLGLNKTLPDFVKLATGDLTIDELSMKERLGYEDMASLKDAMLHHPGELFTELGKGMVDWDTWSDDPYRAAGRLLPDIVASILTGGTSGAASKGLRTVAKVTEMLGDMGGASAGLRRAATKIDDIGAAINVFDRLAGKHPKLDIPDTPADPTPDLPGHVPDLPDAPAAPTGPPPSHAPSAHDASTPAGASQAEHAPESPGGHDPAGSRSSSPEPGPERGHSESHSSPESRADNPDSGAHAEMPDHVPAPTHASPPDGPSSGASAGHGSEPSAPGGGRSDRPESPSPSHGSPSHESPGAETPTVRPAPPAPAEPGSALTTPPTPGSQSGIERLMDRLGGGAEGVGHADHSSSGHDPGTHVDGYPDHGVGHHDHDGPAEGGSHSHEGGSHSHDGGSHSHGGDHDSSGPEDAGNLDPDSGLPTPTRPDDVPDLARYTGSDFRDVNDHLRGIVGDSGPLSHGRVAEVEKIIDGASRDLNRFPVHNGESLRGTHLPQKVLDSITNGGTFKDDAFFSTTTNPRVAHDFMVSGDHRGNAMFHLDGGGRDIRSVFSREGEVLFDRGTEFRVVDKVWNDKGGYWDIHLSHNLDAPHVPRVDTGAPHHVPEESHTSSGEHAAQDTMSRLSDRLGGGSPDGVESHEPDMRPDGDGTGHDQAPDATPHDDGPGDEGSAQDGDHDIDDGVVNHEADSWHLADDLSNFSSEIAGGHQAIHAGSNGSQWLLDKLMKERYPDVLDTNAQRFHEGVPGTSLAPEDFQKNCSRSVLATDATLDGRPTSALPFGRTSLDGAVEAIEHGVGRPFEHVPSMETVANRMADLGPGAMPLSLTVSAGHGVVPGAGGARLGCFGRGRCARSDLVGCVGLVRASGRGR